MKTNPVRFRRNSAMSVAAIVVAIAGLSLLTWAPPYVAILLVIPLSIAVWAWRSGTDADETGLTVRATLGRRRIPWSDVAGVVTEGRLVSAQLVSGRSMTLPGVGAADVPRLVAASGQDIGPGSDGSVTGPR